MNKTFKFIEMNLECYIIFMNVDESFRVDGITVPGQLYDMVQAGYKGLTFVGVGSELHVDLIVSKI